MRSPLIVAVVTLSPVLAGTVRRLLRGGPRATACRHLRSPDAEGFSAVGPDAMVLVPWSWRELAWWLSPLQRTYPTCPLVLFNHLLAGGLFGVFLERQPCTLVGMGATDEEFQAAFWSLTRGVSLCPPGALPQRFTGGAPPLPDGRPLVPPTPAEFPCGCAAALGLSNRQIARILPMSESTARKHISNLLQKLGCANREELGDYFERALSA